jgi:putative transposase
MRKVRSDDDQLREVPRAQRRTMSKPLDEYANHGRKGMVMAYLSGDYTIMSIADHFGAHYSTVSRAIKQFENKTRGERC